MVAQVAPASTLPLEVAMIHHSLNRTRRMLRDANELLDQVTEDVEHLTDRVADLESQLAAARRVAA